jgi:hypothetical protein
VSISNTPLAKVYLAQILSKIHKKVCTSKISGTLFNLTFHFKSKHAAIIGKLAFFEPFICTLQLSSFPHTTFVNIGFLKVKN